METENSIDTMLDSLLGRFGPQMNLYVSIALAAAGIIILAAVRPKGKGRIAAWVCIILGCLGIVSSVVQMLM